MMKPNHLNYRKIFISGLVFEDFLFSQDVNV